MRWLVSQARDVLAGQGLLGTAVHALGCKRLGALGQGFRGGLNGRGIVGVALVADGDLLSQAEHAAIDRLLDEVERSREATDHHAIDAAVEALAQGTEAFAAERMNRGIRAALAGRNVDQI